MYKKKEGKRRQEKKRAQPQSPNAVTMQAITVTPTQTNIKQ